MSLPEKPLNAATAHNVLLVFAGFLPAMFLLIFVQVVNLQKINKEKQEKSMILQEKHLLAQKTASLEATVTLTQQELSSTSAKLNEVLMEDQRVKNKALEDEIKNIQSTFSRVIAVYEDLQDVRPALKKPETLEGELAQILTLLSKRNYASASARLSKLQSALESEKAKAAQTFTIPANVVASNTAPASGYSRQKVNVNGVDFLVDIVAADLNTYKLIVDTASDTDCRDNCPVLPLADYVARNGALAGINGNYFCPASYPSCAGKANSFDTMVMNKNKYIFNRENNVYSTVPGIVFKRGGTSIVSRTLDWGKNTSEDGFIANFPALLSGGNIAGAASDPKQTGKGNRSFVGSKGATGYIGVVRNATVNEVAHVLKTMGLDNALNLDSGGSTALWAAGGYKVGPGRNIPNAILFVKR